MLRVLFGCLISILVCLTALPAWAARGFGPTDGTATTDKLVTTHTSLATSTSWCQWIWLTGAGGNGYGRIFDKNGVDVPNSRFLTYHDTTPAIEFWSGWSLATGTWYIAVPTLAAWHHLCVTYSNSLVSNDPIFYLDNTTPTVTEVEPPAGTAGSSTEPYYIGNRSDDIRHLNGRVAEFAIWEGTILTAGDISTLYNSGAGARADSLATAPTTYWKLCGTASPEPNEIGGGSSATVTGALVQTHPFSNCTTGSGGMLATGVGR